jgi:hypothetical protein
VLVAHAVDMPRASAEFAAQGIAVIKAPTGIPAADTEGLLDSVPGIGGLQGSYYALYEILANAMRLTTSGR